MPAAPFRGGIFVEKEPTHSFQAPSRSGIVNRLALAAFWGRNMSLPTGLGALTLCCYKYGVPNGTHRPWRFDNSTSALTVPFINTPLQRGVGAAGTAKTVLTVLSSRYFQHA